MDKIRLIKYITEEIYHFLLVVQKIYICKLVKINIIKRR